MAIVKTEKLCIVDRRSNLNELMTRLVSDLEPQNVSVKSRGILLERMQLHTGDKKAVLAIVKNHSYFLRTTAHSIEAPQKTKLIPF